MYILDLALGALGNGFFSRMNLAGDLARCSVLYRKYNCFNNEDRDTET